MDSALYWMWLAQAVGFGSRQAGDLLEEYPDAAAVYEAVRSGSPPACLTPQTRARLKAAEPWQLEPLLERCLRSGVTVLTPEDLTFPARLLTLPDAPLVLYATGDTACLNGRRYVGMVGTRRPTAYGRRACREISLALAQAGMVLVSGMADGLDGVGQQAAVDAGGTTVAFLGTPIDKTYPAANAALRRRIEQLGGCVVSEYPPGFEGNLKRTFLARNRLIAGLAEALCVAEARSRSGTLNTSAHAERYGRPVLAVPGSIYSPESQGTNELLRRGGARILCGVGDVLEALGIDAAETATPGTAAPEAAPPVGGDAAAVLEHLSQLPQSVDALCAAAGLPASRVLAALMELEFAGLAAAAPGRRYTAT